MRSIVDFDNSCKITRCVTGSYHQHSQCIHDLIPRPGNQVNIFSIADHAPAFQLQIAECSQSFLKQLPRSVIHEINLSPSDINPAISLQVEFQHFLTNTLVNRHTTAMEYRWLTPRCRRHINHFSFNIDIHNFPTPASKYNMLLLRYRGIHRQSPQRLPAFLDDDSIILRCMENRIESIVVHQFFTLFCQGQFTAGQLRYQTPLAHISKQGLEMLYCNLFERAKSAQQRP